MNNKNNNQFETNELNLNHNMNSQFSQNNHSKLRNEKNSNLNKSTNYFEYKYLSNEKKAEIFTKDSKIFVRSLSDAVVATKQISILDNLRNYDRLYTYILNNGVQNNEFLLVKYCNHDLCDPSLIACRSRISYEIYLMTKFALNIYIKNHSILKSMNTYHEYDEFLTDLLKYMKRDLSDYSKYIKNRYKNDLEKVTY